MERDATGAGGVIKLQIKFGGETIPISLSSDSTVSELKFLLQSSTNVLPRGQKLIHKGKILEDSKTLGSSEISNGSKIMLMASQGLHQADGPKLKGAPIVSNYQRIVSADRNPSRFVEQVSVDKSRAERWKITGVVALSECHLKVIPDEVWDCGSAARVLDLSNNHICDVPAKIGSLTHIQKMMLNANEISDDFISWEGLTYLKSLTYLSLSQNQECPPIILPSTEAKREDWPIESGLKKDFSVCLTALPSTLGTLTTLRQLHIASNILTSLPCELGLLMHLEVLNISNNRISTIPACIGGCHSLIEVDLSSNLLVTLPETFGNLQNLKALHVRNNGLKSLPSTLFKKCLKLSTLDLHGTEITMDMLRLAEGWEEFDKRRRLKHQKQLDFRAGGSAEFDEGADRN